jgi:hypothetical protein
MTEQWYYTSAGRRYGPVSEEELYHQAASGRLQPTDLVWNERMPQWVPARSIEGLLPGGYVGTAVLSAPEPAPAPAAAPAQSPLERWQAEARQERQDYPDHREELARDRYHDPSWGAPMRARPDAQHKELRWIMAIGMAAVVAVVVGIAALVVINAANDPGDQRNFSIRAGEAITYEAKLKAGVRTRVYVYSQYNTDIDLFVWSPQTQLIAKDERDFKDCYVEFVPITDGSYRFEVRNINLGSKLPVGRNQCTIKIEPSTKLSRMN